MIAHAIVRGGVVGESAESGGGHGIVFAFDPIEGFPERSDSERAGPLTIEDTTVTGNAAAGVLSTGRASPQITASTIRDNGGCGLCYVAHSRGSVTDTTVQGNEIGVQAGDNTAPRLRDSTFSGNHDGRHHLRRRVDRQSDAEHRGGERIGRHPDRRHVTGVGHWQHDREAGRRRARDRFVDSDDQHQHARRSRRRCAGGRAGAGADQRQPDRPGGDGRGQHHRHGQRHDRRQHDRRCHRHRRPGLGRGDADDLRQHARRARIGRRLVPRNVRRHGVGQRRHRPRRRCPARWLVVGGGHGQRHRRRRCSRHLVRRGLHRNSGGQPRDGARRGRDHGERYRSSRHQPQPATRQRRRSGVP